MRNRDDWVELELTKQKTRLKYIDTMLRRQTHCDFPPRRIFFEPTNHCNLRCGHCAMHNGSGTRAHGFMNFDVFKKVMDEMADCNRMTEINMYQHGESTLHPMILDMIRYASVEKDFFTKLNTNAVNLTREMSEGLIKANIDALVFTIDAITPETYKIVKGRDVFYKVLNNILDYLEAWGDTEREFPNYFACDIFLVQEELNKNDIPVIREMFERLPIGHVETYELFNYMGAVQEANTKYPQRFEIPREEWPTCNTPWDVVGVRWNGDVVSCIYDYDNRYVIGNVMESNFWDIWNGERMRTFRQAQLNHEFGCVEKKGKLCSNCTIMWQKTYHAPTDFHSEVKRMKFYLDQAIDRASLRHERTEKLLEKHLYLKGHRDTWMRELMERIEPIRARAREELGVKSLARVREKSQVMG